MLGSLGQPFIIVTRLSVLDSQSGVAVLVSGSSLDWAALDDLCHHTWVRAIPLQRA